MEQINLFEVLYEKYIINKPIKLIEFFAGYGSQNLALKYLETNYEHHRICEWATKSIQAYNDIHIRDYTDYSQFLTFDEVLNYLFKKGISMNYNEPMTYDQIKRKGEQWCRTTYNNIIATRNLVNIQQVKGKDLDIDFPEEYTYLLTYSFPCQDLSLAGKGKGMEKGSGTRSGMLWEVERILKECEQGKLPQVLLMENVPQVHSQENMPHLLLWINELEKLGYKSYWQDLNAKNFGIPQNRERCFMVSILGDYYYEFPKKTTLKHKLKDLLESNVDEKYYLSEAMISGMMNTNFESYKLENKLQDLDGIANCIIARFEGTPQCIQVPEATKKGYAEAYEGDGIYINRPHQKRGCVQSGMIQTIKTSCDDIGVVVKVGNYSPSNHNASSIVSGEGIAPTVMENHGTVTAVVEENRFYSQALETLETNECEVGDTINAYNQTVDKSGLCPTLTTRPEGFKTAILPVVENNGDPICLNSKGGRNGIEGLQPSLQDRVYSSSSSSVAITPSFQPSYTDKTGLRIRKLTPRECWRLMGVKDEDYDNVSKNQSNSSLYHLAGDSIVTTCLMALIGELLGIDYQTKIKEMIENEVASYE